MLRILYTHCIPVIMTLGSTQPLTEMSTGNISWGVKVASA
jgi:hypothetical protein